MDLELGFVKNEDRGNLGMLTDFSLFEGCFLLLRRERKVREDQRSVRDQLTVF